MYRPAQAVFELLLWSIEQVAESQAPTYEFAVSVLQTISQVGQTQGVFWVRVTRGAPTAVIHMLQCCGIDLACVHPRSTQLGYACSSARERRLNLRGWPATAAAVDTTGY